MAVLDWIDAFNSLPNFIITSQPNMPWQSVFTHIWSRIWAWITNLLWPSLPNVPQVWGYPIVGILPTMFKGKIFTTIMAKFYDAAEETGVSGSWVGTFPLIYVRDPFIFHQIFVANADNVTRVGPQRNGPFGILHRVAGDIAITADGDDWQRWRRSLLIDFYNHASLRESYKGILNIAQRYVLKMRDSMTGPDLRKVLREYALDTVWYVAIGVDDASSSSNQLLRPLPRFLNTVDNATHLYWHALRNLSPRQALSRA